MVRTWSQGRNARLTWADAIFRRVPCKRISHRSTLAHGLALRVEARQTIGDLVPGRFGLDRKVKRRSHAGICIECPETQA
jgi:hypothetical protein